MRFTQGDGTTPLDVWGNDHDAFLASWENLNAGGHGLWYSPESSPEPYVDELTEAYDAISKQFNDAETQARTDYENSEETDEPEEQ